MRIHKLHSNVIVMLLFLYTSVYLWVKLTEVKVIQINSVPGFTVPMLSYMFLLKKKKKRER